MPNDDYIKRSEVVEELCGQCRFYDSSNDCGLKICSAYPRKERINAIPAADVEPVRHGRWIWDDEGFHCSECWFHAYGDTGEVLSGHYLYCPNCGAKMDKEADDV